MALDPDQVDMVTLFDEFLRLLQPAQEEDATADG